MSPKKLSPQWIHRSMTSAEIRLPEMRIYIGPHMSALGLYLTVTGMLNLTAVRLDEEYDIEKAKTEALEKVSQLLEGLNKHVKGAL